MLFGVRGGQGEGNRFVVGVQQQQERVADQGFAALVHVADQVAREPDAVHFFAVRPEPGDVGDAAAPNVAALEESSPLENRLLLPDVRRSADEIEKPFLVVVQIPIEPGQFVVLTIRVIVALLRVAELVTGEQHRHALGQQQGRDQVALLPLP